MPTIQVLHNPRCSKSRATLALLEDNGVEYEVLEYLKRPFTTKNLKDISAKLGLKPSQFMRKGEFAKIGVEPATTEENILQQMAEHPILVERPIVINGDKARIGRPPEAILDIL